MLEIALSIASFIFIFFIIPAFFVYYFIKAIVFMYVSIRNWLDRP